VVRRRRRPHQARNEASEAAKTSAHDAAGRRRTTTMDLYRLQKLLEYNQQELARARGHRNWVSLFKR
jgi:hypothetical protein